MSIPSQPPLSLTEAELRLRVAGLDSEIRLLRAQLEEQSWRMAQLVLENAALKNELGANALANPAPRKTGRNPYAVISREEMEFALKMGRADASAPNG